MPKESCWCCGAPLSAPIYISMPLCPECFIEESEIIEASEALTEAV